MSDSRRGWCIGRGRSLPAAGRCSRRSPGSPRPWRRRARRRRRGSLVLANSVPTGPAPPRHGFSPPSQVSHALEIGQHVGIGPAARALLRPAVVVAAIAAGIGHHVDRRRAAQHLAAHRLDLAAVHVRLGLGAIAPVEHVVFVHLAHAERDMDERIEVAPARFDQQHARRAVLAQPVGQHAAGRAGADDDVVVACLHVCTPSVV